jgi:hypothetical protein
LPKPIQGTLISARSYVLSERIFLMFFDGLRRA